MSASPTFILVPGHWHTPTHAEPVVSALKSKNHKALAVQLASVGHNKATHPTFEDDVKVIVDAVSASLKAGEDVCLILHSYSGMPGAEALNRLKDSGILEKADGRGKLVRAIFITAFAFPAGVEMNQKALIGPAFPGFSMDENDIMHMANPYHYFFSALPNEAAAQKWIDALEPAYYMNPCPVISSETWRTAVPVTALLCGKDNTIPAERQEAMWQGTETEWLPEADHVPLVSAPEECAEKVARIVARGITENEVAA